MKTTVLTLTSAFVLLLICFSCNSEEDPTTGIRPVLSNSIDAGNTATGQWCDEITAFFDEYLPSHANPESQGFFAEEANGDRAMVLNSTEDFRQSFSGPAGVLPVIDFNSYTLIIGRHYVPNSPYYVLDQCFVPLKGKPVLYLKIGKPDAQWTVLSHVDYWGLYPKLEKSPVSVKIDYIRMQHDSLLH